MAVASLARPDTNGPIVALAETRCARCLGRERSVCADLSPDILIDMAGASRVRRLRRGEVLSWEGDEAHEVGNVRDGALKLTASMRDGREQILGVAWPGSFVGDLFTDKWSYRATALANTTICMFRRADIKALVARNPQVAEALLRRLSDDLVGARRSILSLGRKTAAERVATLLIDIRRTAIVDAAGAIQMPLNRQQMADLLGLTIETVSRKIHRMEHMGVIALTGPRLFRIIDEVGLVRLAG